MTASMARAEFAIKDNGKRSLYYDIGNAYEIVSSELTAVFHAEFKDSIDLLPADLTY